MLGERLRKFKTGVIGSLRKYLDVEQERARQQAIDDECLLLLGRRHVVIVSARVHHDGAPLAQVVVVHDLVRADLAAVAVGTHPRYFHREHRRPVHVTSRAYTQGWCNAETCITKVGNCCRGFYGEERE
jgi:hypothetical protein